MYVHTYMEKKLSSHCHYRLRAIKQVLFVCLRAFYVQSGLVNVFCLKSVPRCGCSRTICIRLNLTTILHLAGRVPTKNDFFNTNKGRILKVLAFCMQVFLCMSFINLWMRTLRCTLFENFETKQSPLLWLANLKLSCDCLVLD